MINSLVFFLMIRRPPRSTQSRSSAASDVYKRQFMYDDILLGKIVEEKNYCKDFMLEVALVLCRVSSYTCAQRSMLVSSYPRKTEELWTRSSCSAA